MRVLVPLLQTQPFLPCVDVAEEILAGFNEVAQQIQPPVVKPRSVKPTKSDEENKRTNKNLFCYGEEINRIKFLPKNSISHYLKHPSPNCLSSFSWVY